MDPVAAYGLAVNLGPAVAPSPAAPAGVPVNGPGLPFEAVWRVDRWESAAFGALLIIGLALYVNALDAS